METTPPITMAVCGDSVSSLSGETLEKARRELNEDPATRMEVISQLREKIASWEAKPEEEGVQFSRRDDHFLLCFLRARKFDVERALQLYVNYHLHRGRNASLLGDFQPHSSEAVLRGGILSVLEARSRDGCRVLMFNAGRWDMEATPMEELMRALLLVLDRLVEEEETQVNGFIFIENLAEVGIGQVLQMARAEQVQKGFMVNLIQEAFPGRFKGIHVINQPWYISIVMAIMMPFMKKKLRDRIHLHGIDYESLHEFIDPTHLPSDLGGGAPPSETFSAARLFPELALPPEELVPPPE